MIIENTNVEKLWSRFLLKLKVQHPFFATVAMFAHFSLDEQVTVAQTLNKQVVINPHFLTSISEDQRFSYLLHQILHLALGHIPRGQGRNELLWNIAADISVNNIIVESTAWPAAPQTAWDRRYSGDSVERIYASLQKQVSSQTPPQASGTNSANSEVEENNRGDSGQAKKTPLPSKIQDKTKNASGQSEKNDLTNPNQQKQTQGKAESTNHQSETNNSGASDQQNNAYADLAKKYNCQTDFNTNQNTESQASQEYWRTSMIKATQLNAHHQQGKGSASLNREIDLAVNGQIEWRPLLWKYATPDLVDYHEFDHRFIHAGYYTETLLSESIIVDVVVDTSGSITRGELSRFLAEMRAIHTCHPDIKLQFYYADDQLYGPYEIPNNINNLPVPIGTGGTSFIPYFNQLDKNKSLLERPQAIIYFTDGYGYFPTSPPPTPVLWLLTEDGLQDEKIPFGTAVRIKD